MNPAARDRFLDGWSIPVVCTGRMTHRMHVFAHALDPDDYRNDPDLRFVSLQIVDPEGVTPPTTPDPPDAERVVGTPGRSMSSVRFRCPECRRHTQIKSTNGKVLGAQVNDRLTELVRHARHAGLPFIDLSALD